MRPPERIDAAPEFLELTGWHDGGGPRWEIASRRRLDTRQVVPWFSRDGVVHVGVLERARASRRLRGAPEIGLEPIGIDFAGVDETGDVLEYGRAVFSARAAVAIDDAGLVIPLPSVARSIGYATELALPLLLPIEPPQDRSVPVSWDGRAHRIVFEPVEAVRARLAEQPFDEILALALDALSPPPRLAHPAPRDDADAGGLLDRHRDRLRDRASLVADAHAWTAAPDLARAGALRGRDLRFLALHRVHDGREPLEIVTPRSGVSLAVLPIVRDGAHPWVLLWSELRVAALERRARQPIFDLPVAPRYTNATARYLDGAEAAAVRDGAGRAVAERALRDLLGPSVRARSFTPLGPPGEPAPSFSSELRFRAICELDPRSLDALPRDVVLVRADELAAAVRDGAVRDPVVVSALLALGLDPFEQARRGDPPRRRAFVDRMTEGSVVLRRLRAYSSIEREQLRAPTYARVMLKLQHEFGVRIAYPKSEADRGFFKAAFRVFMASPRSDDDRALQGLHWSHDAFHFALGNLTLPEPPGFEDWFVSGEPAPEPAAPEGPTYEAYAHALKLAEDEATFFSFWTLYEEEPALARHVGRLTFWQGLRLLGVHERDAARAIFDDVTARALLPERVASSAAYRARDDVRALFAYMLGFREHHLKDIRAAFRHASRDPYRGPFLRFGIYEGDPARYVEGIRGFDASLRAQPPGLNPLLAATAEVRVSIALRVFDVTKAMRLLRAAVDARVERTGRVAARRAVLALAERALERLEVCDARRRALRERIGDAELSPRNESVFAEVAALAAHVERARDALWSEVERTDLLEPRVVDAERARELPR